MIIQVSISSGTSLENTIRYRPILTACVDAYSGLCCGYSLGWEGGTYSLRDLMLNVVADKPEHCKSFGTGFALVSNMMYKRKWVWTMRSLSKMSQRTMTMN